MEGHISTRICDRLRESGVKPRSRPIEILERRVLLTASPAALPPTLIASPIARATLPPAVVYGEAAKGAVKFEVAVDSGREAKGMATISVYTSSSETIDGSSVLLGKVTKHVNLFGGG